jgi:hypothetical protein
MIVFRLRELIYSFAKPSGISEHVKSM